MTRAIDITGKIENSEAAQSRYMGNLSIIYRLKGMLPEAERMAASALRMREKLFGPDSMQILYEIQDLASVYGREKKYEQAEPLFRRAVTILEKNLGPDHPDVANACLSHANVLASLKRYAEALPLYRRNVEISDKRYGPKALKTAWALGFVARALQFSDQYDESEALFKRVIDIEEADASEAGKAQAWIARDQFAVLLEAEGRYREEAELLERAFGAAGASSTAMRFVAEAYRREGFLAKADTWLAKSIDTNETMSSPEFVSDRLLKIALVDYDRHRYTQAAAQLQQALVLAEKANDAPARVAVLEELGNVRRDMHQFGEAAKLYHEVLTIREQDSPDRPAMAHLLDDMALMLIMQNRPTEAEPQLLRAKRIYERAMGGARPIEAPVFLHLALLYRDQKRYSDAEPLFKRSIELQEKGMSSDAPALAPALREFAQFCRAQNRMAEASALEQRGKNLAAANH